ncbi:ThuA domain-containing protein [bacterium]|nr:ThuA domain-containing protein [bacterium]
MTLRILLGLILLSFINPRHVSAEDHQPHVVLVVGTLHYSPELTMPLFAKELEKFGFRTTVVMGEGDPEKKTENVLPGIEALAEADLVIFFTRFLKLPDNEWQVIEDYLKKGKPVIGLRTASHAIRYPKTHPRFDWNDGFGRRVFGSPYVVHQSSETQIKVVPENIGHPIMTHVKKSEWISLGTLYLAQLEDGCLPLVSGSGTGRERLLKKRFGEIQVKKFETAPVAWAWENEWGGKSFYTSFGHPGDFAEVSFNRMFINAVHWGLDRPVPGADVEISTWEVERVDKKGPKR